MSTLLIAVASFFGFILAYHTYGRWLAKKVFSLDGEALVPAEEMRDDVDYVPTKKEIIFGHHFTSIAGTGPIVGPAIAVFWGWLPALLWVIFGSIFVGAVHDMGSLVVSLRNRGQTIGEVAGRLINPRAKVLFLLILFFALTIVLAIFGLVIAIIFKLYPQSVLSVWIEIPLAVAIGYWVYRRGGGLLVPSLLALAVMYGAIYVGAYYLPLSLPVNPADAVVIWTLVLFVYCFFASVLPVWTLLQPRDYINSHELVVALGLLMLGLVVAGWSNTADIFSAPAYNYDTPADTPPIWPMLFITIACGAVSGFHCLVASGTTSKQIANEKDAQYVGYGAMLLEGGLAVIVILACCAGVGMGQLQGVGTTHLREYAVDAAGAPVVGHAAWLAYYPNTRTTVNATTGETTVQKGWASQKLPYMLAAFIDGGANFLTALRIPIDFGVGIIAVLVASFAATTLDTATRLQRYVVQELAETLHIRPLTNKYAATAFALVLAGALAAMPASKGGDWGTGGLILWPLFGATNQLLAGLAFMVIVFYLWRRSKPVLFAVIPMLLMLLTPVWAMLWQMFNADSGWLPTGKYLLFSFGVLLLALQIWMVVEAVLIWPKAAGVLEEALPPLPPKKEGKKIPATT
ncbi:carbon starvation CstA family protein [Lignipirellula cremea]|uniref:Carbon starvation protein A n=1 Tax=Lignipirellula cremea TaxID=2528010 RepID=A0A518E1S5_9BACT|nr:carbon starvation protein A [Lignipirellula cremea]QDU98045.1 Carbon starvation protein A [Lignipirellula cremea]